MDYAGLLNWDIKRKKNDKSVASLEKEMKYDVLLIARFNKVSD